MTNLRLSRTRQGGGGIERQREDCAELARAVGLRCWTEFVDEGRSAYRDGARAGFDALLKRARGAASVAVVVWHLDRITRQPAQLEELIRIAVDRRVQVHAVHGGLLDLSTHEGRMIARFMASFAYYESAAGAARMARAHRDTAQRGGWHGAAAYGYRAGGVIEPAEAAVVRQMVEDYLAGCSESEIARRLNARDVPTPGTSAGWHRSSVQSILRSDRLHHVRRPPGGGVVAGSWTPIIPEDMVELLDAALLARGRRSTSSSKSLLGVSPAAVGAGDGYG